MSKFSVAGLTWGAFFMCVSEQLVPFAQVVEHFFQLAIPLPGVDFLELTLLG
jgi:hypothetical protein